MSKGLKILVVTSSPTFIDVLTPAFVAILLKNQETKKVYSKWALSFPYIPDFAKCGIKVGDFFSSGGFSE